MSTSTAIKPTPLNLNINIPAKCQVLWAPMRYKGLRGGRGSAKSHTFAALVVLKCYAQMTRIVCIREVQNSIRESVRQLLIDKIVEMNLGSFFTITDAEIRGRNGSLIIFKGMRDYNAANIKSLEGYDIAWVEEAQTLSSYSMQLLRPTLRKDGSELWFSWNPRRKSDPVDKFFCGHIKYPDAICIELNWLDNHFFPDVLRAEKDNDYNSNPELAHHIWGGGYEVVGEGSYYGRDLVAAENAGRITSVGYDRATPVFCAWDLGIGDRTALIHYQRVGLEWHFIDYYEANGFALDHYLEWSNDHPYQIHTHVMPHDAEARELQTGKSRHQFMIERGLRVTIVPMHLVADGIHAVRMVLPQCWFDSARCEKLIECVRNYRSEFLEPRGVVALRPRHDEYSHGADALRYAVMGVPDIVRISDWKKPIKRQLQLIA